MNEFLIMLLSFLSMGLAVVGEHSPAEYSIVYVRGDQVFVTSAQDDAIPQPADQRVQDALVALHPTLIRWTPEVSGFTVYSKDQSLITVLTTDLDMEVVVDTSDLPGEVGSLAWSNDGAKLAIYSLELSDEGTRDLWWINIYDTSAETLETIYERGETAPEVGGGVLDWSADGTTLIFSAQAGNFEQNLYLLSVTCQQQCEPEAFRPEEVGGSSEDALPRLRSPGLHPTMPRLGFVCDNVLCFANLDGSAFERFEDVTALGSLLNGVVWSPDASAVVYVNEHELLDVFSINTSTIIAHDLSGDAVFAQARLKSEPDSFGWIEETAGQSLLGED